MITIGLTGGIATGKSTVSRILKSAGAIVIDADAIARDVVEPGRPAYDHIIRHFGDRVLKPDGTLNRSRLAEIVFTNSAERRVLNRIVHPYVSSEIERQLAEIESNRPEAVVVLDVPLLFEIGMQKGLAEVIVVYAPESAQYKRLIQRDGISREEAGKKIRSQLPLEQKRRMATIVIDNSGGLDHTCRETLAVYEKIKQKYSRSKSNGD